MSFFLFYAAINLRQYGVSGLAQLVFVDPLHHCHPQLRRSVACSGFRIEVPLRGTRS